VITVASGSFVFPFQFTLRNILTPKFTPSSKVYLETYTSDSYLIDRNSDILFATACTLPCKGCVSAVLNSQCTSCYSDPTLVSNLVILSGNTCRSVCPIGQYEDTNTVSCVPCSTNCESCQNFNICLSCNNNRYLHLQDCLTDCLIGFYKYSARCLPCDKTTLHCESCANSYECLTCEAPYLVYNKVCYLICPALITYANTLTKTCEACPANCLQCTGDFTLVTCSKCANGYVLDNGGCYVDCVTSGLVKSNGECVACSTLCGTCSLTTTNCTSCLFPSSNPYHFNFKCLSTCPSTFFNDNSTYTCSKCTPPCEQCKSVSISSCESCLTPYLFAAPVCLSVCDPGFYKSRYSCVQCTNDCQ
jgi:proprotein convertase subtilisin/kexin type 5